MSISCSDKSAWTISYHAKSAFVIMLSKKLFVLRSRLVVWTSRLPGVDLLYEQVDIQGLTCCMNKSTSRGWLVVWTSRLPGVDLLYKSTSRGWLVVWTSRLPGVDLLFGQVDFQGLTCCLDKSTTGVDLLFGRIRYCGQYQWCYYVY